MWLWEAGPPFAIQLAAGWPLAKPSFSSFSNASPLTFPLDDYCQ